MKAEYESAYHEAEDRHWWFRGRRDFFIRLARRLELTRDAEILDIGCASGSLVETFERRGYKSVRGIDISSTAIRQSRRRGLHKVFRMDASAASFHDDFFDLVIASDILEHIEEEQRALLRWHRLVKPGGTLAIFVPAFSFLWSAHDDANMHFRRYTERQLLRSLTNAGFEVTFSSYWNFTLFGPTAIFRLLGRCLPQRKPPHSNELHIVPLLNELLSALILRENAALIRRIPLPVGVSVMALARRPS